ncbi:MAG: 16S rRNA (cytosine(1402)-N(4))-methyltransferase RsmH [Candidatus Ancillula sp.]|jgi:16S rRNA (cytosine1402-N4)-methyltransferase|nr:16S rRNA (cytosine(1402)-N(4))-methyltransferase RsmH [Candidatus Ancillula sp.]
MQKWTHMPVMAERVWDLIEPALEGNNKTYFDCTLGLGGHSKFFLEKSSENKQIQNMKIVGIDRDQKALNIASERLNNYEDQFIPFKGNYAEITRASKEKNRTPDAVLLDLGVSSMQLDDEERGFSYTKNAPLDMRMDQATGLTAKELIDDLEVEELISVLKEFGEERYSKNIAEKMKESASKGNLNSTSDLADLIRASLPAKVRHNNDQVMSSIKRVFQALRIAVNTELDSLQSALDQIKELVNKNGRVVVLSYHSLEDRIVKRAFNNWTGNVQKSEVELSLPFELNINKPEYEFLVRGSEKASKNEQDKNPRSISVRLRAVKKNA